MKKKVITILVIIILLLVVINAGVLGFLWYRNNHVFVDGKAYPIRAQVLNLLEQEDVSIEHYDTLHALLPECEIYWNVPFQGGRYPNDTTQLQISALTREDIAILVNYFPALRKVDASGCSDYPMLEALKSQMPDLEVSYVVSLGSKAFAPDTTTLSLEPGDYDYEILMGNLPFLHKVETILLKTPDISMEQLDALKAAYPDILIGCTVEIMGKEYGSETTQLDLSGITAQDIPVLCEKFAMLPDLQYVELTDSEGRSSLEKEEVRELMRAVPDVEFHYTFEFYGEVLSTTDTEEVHIRNKKIGDSGEAEVRLALDLLQNCKRFVLENCSISNELMSQIRDDYREKTKVVWRVYFGVGSTMTDAEVIRAVYDLVDDNSHNLIYCEDVRYMDIGHDDYLDSIDFVSGMKSLEVVIVSGSPIKDLSPFANCKNLRILEAANCGYITDLSPLAECKNLEMLNICYTKVKDLSPLDDLNLTHLHAKGLYRTLIPVEEQARFKEKHPDCLAYFSTGEQPYGPGWRYEVDNPQETMDWYKDIQKAFRYPNAPNHVGWYLDK